MVRQTETKLCYIFAQLKKSNYFREVIRDLKYWVTKVLLLENLTKTK